MIRCLIADWVGMCQVLYTVDWLTGTTRVLTPPVETILFLILSKIVVPQLLVCTLPFMVMWLYLPITRQWTFDILLNSTCTMVQTAKRYIQAIFTTLGHNPPIFNYQPPTELPLKSEQLWTHHACRQHSILSSNIPLDHKIHMLWPGFEPVHCELRPCTLPTELTWKHSGLLMSNQLWLKHIQSTTDNMHQVHSHLYFHHTTCIFITTKVDRWHYSCYIPLLIFEYNFVWYWLLFSY